MLIRCKNIWYRCTSCYEVFPFQNISDDKLIFETSSVEVNYDTNKLMEWITAHNLISTPLSIQIIIPMILEMILTQKTICYNNIS